MEKIGFLGMGIMGSAMAKNLINSGYKINIWNRTKEKCDGLVALGAKYLPTPKDVIKSSDICFAMVSDPLVSEEICFSENGVIAGIEKGKGFINCSTVDANHSIKLDKAIAEKGGLFLEAPVSGSRKPAEDAQLIFICAGSRELLKMAEPALEKMGKKILYLGKTGNAANMKIINNFVMGNMLASLCEGLSLGIKAGLKPEDILQVLDDGIVSNPLFRFKGQTMLKSNFDPAFPLKHMQKDYRLAINWADSLNHPLFLTSIANEMYKKAKEKGYENEDFSSIFKIFGDGK